MTPLTPSPRATRAVVAAAPGQPAELTLYDDAGALGAIILQPDAWSSWIDAQAHDLDRLIKTVGDLPRGSTDECGRGDDRQQRDT
jgi:hypothetical protein